MKKVLLFVSALVAGHSLSYAQQAVAKRDTSRFSNNVALDEVVVTATKAMKGTPVAYTNFSKEQIAEKNFGQDVPYLISQTPSVIVTSDAGTGIGYTGFRVRGTDANRINITVNGVPMNDSESHTVFWVNMPDFASSVENVQIQRGVGTSTNGAASFGATIAMQTQGMSYKPYAEVSTAGGSFGTFKTTGKVSTGLLKNKFVFDARASHIQSDGFIDRASANMNSYFASGAYYGDNTMIKFQTFGSKEKTYQSWNGVSSDKLKTDRTFNSCGMYTDENGVTRFYDNQTDNYQQQHYHLMATQRVGDYWNMNATLHYTRGKGYYEDYKPNSKFGSYKLPAFTDKDGNEIKRSDLVRQKWLDNHFFGAVYSANYRKDNWHLTFGAAANKYDGSHYGKVIWVKNIMNLDPDHEYYRSNGDKLDYNAFAKLNVMMTKGLNGYVDLQYRGIDYRMKGEDDKAGMLDIHKNYNFFNPKLGLNYAFAKNHNAFVSFSIANREPNRNNFTEAAENERPTFETLYDYEVGYEFRTDRFHVGANLYFMDYNNQLILTGKISEIGEALTSNIKDSYRTGIELMGGVRITNWLNWEGNVTLSQNKIKNFTEFVDDWDTGEQITKHYDKTNIAFSPNVIANSMFNFGYKGFTAAFNSSFVGRQYMDNTASSDRSIDPYFVNNVRFGYTFKPKFMETITVDFTVNNLFNEQYETNGWVYSYFEGGVRKKDDGYFTQAGTNFMGRLVMRF